MSRHRGPTSEAARERRRVLIADQHFVAGRLADAESLCRALWKENNRGPLLRALLGEILLLRNRTAEAEPLLREAAAEQGGNPRLLRSLAECLRRGDRLAEAADLYARLGRAAFAHKLKRLAEGGCYLAPETAAADLPWASEATLPVVKLAVNGAEGLFLLDTGVGETLIDPALARSGGVVPLGVERIHFPSGPAAQAEHAILESLALGDLLIGRVPAQVYPVREAFGGLLGFPIEGILGTGLFSRFPTTLDYQERRLRLGIGERLTQGTPFYLAGEQYPLVDARINDRLNTLLFLDTGMGGAALALPFSTAEEADVEVAPDLEGAGFGISSAIQARPFICRSLAAAGAVRQDLPGMLIGNFRLEHPLGFHVGGLLGDGFVKPGALTLDFGAMRLALKLGASR